MASRYTKIKENPRVTKARRGRKWAAILKFNPNFIEENADDLTYIKAVKDKHNIEVGNNDEKTKGRKRYLDNSPEDQLLRN